jgi:hypothetical protein
MNEEPYYIYDFYQIYRQIQQSEVISLLEKNDRLSELLGQYLEPIIDKLFSLCTNAVINQMSIKDELVTTINNEVSKTLRNHKLYHKYTELNQDISLFRRVSDKIYSQVFNDERVNDYYSELVDYVKAWVEKCLAVLISQDERFSSGEILCNLFLYTQRFDNFYHNFLDNFDREWIDKNLSDWLNISEPPERICNVMASQREIPFLTYADLLKSMERFRLWSILKESMEQSNYIVLNEKYSFVSIVLLQYDLPHWILFWDNLKFPAIQAAVFHKTILPNQYINILKELMANKDRIKSDFGCLFLILLNSFFHTTIHLSEKFYNFKNENQARYLDQSFIEKGKKVAREWNVDKKKYYHEILTLVNAIMIPADLEDWFFSFKQIEAQPSFNSQTLEITLILDIYQEVYKDSIDLKNFENFLNFEKIIFYIHFVSAADVIKPELAEGMLNSIFAFIKSDAFFWDRSLSNINQKVLGSIAFLLSETKNPQEQAKNLIAEFQVNHEGWKIAGINYKLQMQESFILCAAVSLLRYEKPFNSEDEKNYYYDQLFDIILMQNRFSIADNAEYYQYPLLMLYDFIINRDKEMRLSFESTVIDKIDSIELLLFLFTQFDIPFEMKIKELLENRFEEILYKKTQLEMAKQKRESAFIVYAMEKLKLKKHN